MEGRQHLEALLHEWSNGNRGDAEAQLFEAMKPELRRWLDKMQQEHRDWCAIVELKVFLGLTDKEAAAALNVSVRRLQQDWLDASHWLFDRLIESLPISRVIDQATLTFGSKDLADEWLKSPSAALGGVAPISLTLTANGQELVLEELNRIAHGMLA